MFLKNCPKNVSHSKQAEYVLQRIGQRFKECGLAIHPDKSGIVYCKDKNRQGKSDRICFDFLGYQFGPRRCVNKQGIPHPNFLPAISKTARKAIIREIRSWHIQLKNGESINNLSEKFNAVLRGWYNYYGRFYPSKMISIWNQFNWYLAQWVRRKYKKLQRSNKRAREYLNHLAHANPNLFIHWKLGIMPGVRMVRAV